MRPWDPRAYDAWYGTPLGELSGHLEKELVFSMAGIGRGESALDAGCGTGIYSIELAKRGAVAAAIDASLEMLAFAKAKASQEGLAIGFSQADASSLPFPDDTFDVVISVNMLCFTKEEEKSLSEMRRVLKPGGRLVVGVLNRWSPWAALRRVKGFVRQSVYNEARFISPAGLERMLHEAGFEAVSISTCLFFLPINWRPYLKIALPFERLDSILIPRLGAFLAASGSKICGRG